MKIRSNRPKEEVKRILREIPGDIQGTGPDRFGIGEAFRSAAVHSLFTSIYEGYLIKSLGGVDECGHSWPPLKPETLAYSRPDLRKGLSLPGPKYRPTLTAKQDKVWRGIFNSIYEGRTGEFYGDAAKRVMKIPKTKTSTRGTVSTRITNAIKKLVARRLAKQVAQTNARNGPNKSAAASAASIAWSIVKKFLGATTLYELLGNENAARGISSGRLLKSYEPALPSVPYQPINSDQSYKIRGNKIEINSLVPYRPEPGSERSAIPPNTSVWTKKAIAAGKAAMVKRLEEVLS